MDTLSLREDLWRPIPDAINFTLRDALYLPKWEICVTPARKEWAAILYVAKKLQTIRDLFGEPITVHDWFRPKAYNDFIGGAMFSAHTEGRAVDFHVQGVSCDDVRKFLLPKLETLNIRMENKPGTDWVHIDTREPGPGGRYFKP